MARKLYIHCGLHKTGTTALQSALHAGGEGLRAAGVDFPRATRPAGYHGQHNLAWQLARDRRFHRRHGDLGSLFEEIGRSDGDVVISSEDFESSLLHPERWLRLLRNAQSARMDVKFVIYLRGQVDSLESIYLENLKHGCGAEYRATARTVLENGRFAFEEWEFCFDYRRIASALSALSGVEVIFRDYGALLGNSVLDDFSAVIGIDARLLGRTESARKLNRRNSLRLSLTRYVQNRIHPQKVLAAGESEAISRLCHGLPSPVTSGALRDRLHEKFAGNTPGKLVSANTAGTGLGGFPPPETVRGTQAVQVSMQKVFSFETQLVVQQLSGITARAAAAGNPDSYRSSMEKISDRWREWVKVGGREGDAETPG